MGIFDRKPNIEKMRAKGDVNGLIRAFQKYGDENIDPLNMSTNPAIALQEIIRICEKRGNTETIWTIYRDVYPCEHKWDKATLDEEAILTLGKMGDKRAVEHLIKIVRKTPCRSAVSALGKFKDKRAVEPLIKVLEEIPERGYLGLGSMPFSPDTVVDALYVVHALVEIGDERAIGPLKNVLKDSGRYAKSYVVYFQQRWNVKFFGDSVPQIESVIKETVKGSIKKLQKAK